MEAEDGTVIPWAIMRSASVGDRRRRARQLLDYGILHAECLVLVQSRHVYERAENILGLYEAVRAGMRIVTVLLLGSDYDYEIATRELEQLEEHLGAHCNEAEMAVLRDLLHARHHATLMDAQLALAHNIPNIISVQLDMSAHRRIIDATVEDIVERLDPTRMAGAPAVAPPQANAGPKSVTESSPSRGFSSRSTTRSLVVEAPLL